MERLEEGRGRASGLREDRWEGRGLIGVLEGLWRELDDKYPLQEASMHSPDNVSLRSLFIFATCP